MRKTRNLVPSGASVRIRPTSTLPFAVQSVSRVYPGSSFFVFLSDFFPAQIHLTVRRSFSCSLFPLIFWPRATVGIAGSCSTSLLFLWLPSLLPGLACNKNARCEPNPPAPLFGAVGDMNGDIGHPMFEALGRECPGHHTYRKTRQGSKGKGVGNSFIITTVKVSGLLERFSTIAWHFKRLTSKTRFPSYYNSRLLRQGVADCTKAETFCTRRDKDVIQRESNE
ncbi:hypothetical protein F4780DRAFT_728845 [Xylariomycetidae sp. FL0641]|nr:hypothetical protein F4780DRAFT_728845 [Xylariomycetidae sp. FL0641]